MAEPFPVPGHDNGLPRTLVVVAMETLWPANHGGRVDRWTRFALLKQLGWTLIFVGWAQDDSYKADAHRAAMGRLFDHCVFFDNRLTIRSVARRVMLLHRHSPHMSARMISRTARRKLVADLATYAPDAVMMDGLYGAELGTALARDLQIPLLYRSHNVEHRYMADQAAAARGWKRKLAARLAALHLKRAELDIQTQADWVFDISTDDMKFWADHGVVRASWLPPLTLAETDSANALPWTDRPYDLAYLGNLNTPNNVEGLGWFIEQVLPSLRALRPDVSILLAGSNPSPQMQALAAGHAEITILANPEDGAATRRMGRVLINPILRGSGVNVKSVEMLMTDSPVITTPIGVQGLDADTRAAFALSSDPAEWATMIDTLIDGGPVSDSERNAHRDRFGLGAARTLSRTIEDVIRAKG